MELIVSFDLDGQPSAPSFSPISAALICVSCGNAEVKTLLEPSDCIIPVETQIVFLCGACAPEVRYLSVKERLLHEVWKANWDAAGGRAQYKRGLGRARAARWREKNREKYSAYQKEYKAAARRGCKTAE